MARRAIDVVAAGPPSADLYDPAAPAWALAFALAGRGHSVQVTFPGPTDAPPAPGGVSVAPFPPVTPHLGSYLGDAELAQVAGSRIRPMAEVVVRDPSGLGPLGHRARRAAVVAFVRTIAVEAVGATAPGPSAERLGSRVLAWRERRGIRHLEKEALTEATVVYCATAAQRERLRNDHGLAAERLRVSPPVVTRAHELPHRELARRLVGVPNDIHLAILLPPVDPSPAAVVAPALEAFRRIRPIFPGARLAVLGVPGVVGPGIVTLPSRDEATVLAAVAAADVAIAFPAASTVDPGMVLALRAGVPTVVDPTADLGEGAETAVRRAATADSGELASVLTGLLADPDDRRALAEGARAFSSRFEPERLAEELEAIVARGAG
jgi:hypothetical protein